MIYSGVCEAAEREVGCAVPGLSLKEEERRALAAVRASSATRPSMPICHRFKLLAR
jgi:hypothetical protein